MAREIDMQTDMPAGEESNRTAGKVRWIRLGLRLFLGGIFLYASWDKVLNPDAFATSVRNYQILPESLVHLAALILPWLELFVAICLLGGFWLPGAVFWVNTLMLVFTLSLVLNMVRGINVSCGCFSTETKLVGTAQMWGYLIRDLVFLGAGGWLAFLLFREKQRKGGAEAT
jgi:uncharacterized membrane protein YphA (DoxX/SURF4 family)